MMRLRHAGRTTWTLVVYTFRSGRWWMPLLLVVLSVVAVTMSVTKIVVPTVVYTLF